MMKFLIVPRLQEIKVTATMTAFPSMLSFLVKIYNELWKHAMYLMFTSESSRHARGFGPINFAHEHPSTSTSGNSNKGKRAFGKVGK
jgi:hypothetical protein